MKSMESKDGLINYYEGCESYTDEELSHIDKGRYLCDEWYEAYDDKTGYCGLYCCLGYGCDQTC